MDKLLDLMFIAVRMMPGSVVFSDVSGFRIVTIPDSAFQRGYDRLYKRKVSEHKRKAFLR